MRLEAKAKLGYYPVNPETISFICKGLRVTNPEHTYLLDPCCGRGMAVKQMAEVLKIPFANVVGIELDSGRAQLAQESMPESRVINASFFGVRCSPVQSVSIAWLNPPYDDELKQGDNRGRAVESSFLEEALRLVIPGGIVILHMPEDRMHHSIQMAMTCYCVDVHLVTLPKDCSPYREKVMVGIRREKPTKAYWPERKFISVMPQLDVPAGQSFTRLTKFTPTDDEIDRALASAPWQSVFHQKQKRVKLQPALPMGAGHLGLTLAAGLLDGYFRPDGWEEHVVRGIATKDNVLVKKEEEVSDTGKETTTEIYRESFRLKVRAITRDGSIHEIT